MFDLHIKKIATEFGLEEKSVRATVNLLDDGATLPFISRYRKEATGGLDEVAVGGIRDRILRLRQTDERRQAIIRSLSERGLLTSSLQESLSRAESLARLEDIYLPFRPRRRTRASAARERGLEPLARRIFDGQASRGLDPERLADSFVDAEKGVSSAEEALAGARDIMAEWMSEDPEARSRMRMLFETQGVLRCIAVDERAAGKADPKEEGKAEKIAAKDIENTGKFRDYMDYSEPISRASPHRLLAMLRGARLGVLRLHVAPAEEEGLSVLEELFLKVEGPAADQVRVAAQDGYRRLVAPSLENETLAAARARAEEKAIEVFAKNLRQVLLEPPLGHKRILAVDPGYRTGCKLAVLDGMGQLLESHVIYPHDPDQPTGAGRGEARRQAESMVRDICRRCAVEAIAVGNGTAGRETEQFLRSLNLGLKGKEGNGKGKSGEKLPIIMVNESGASVYSTSEIARQELSHVDATVRGTVSIGRRLMDPLAELVKIEPRAIGVGQYQHDVDGPSLQRALDDAVASCVNLVGVDLNSASRELLARVSGLGPKLAAAVVKYREEHGMFLSRKDLLKVPRLGPKAFEQAAGFLRIRDGKNPLDGTAVHPESYAIVERMAADLGVPVERLMKDPVLRERLEPERYFTDKARQATIQDIMEELSRPGRDPRREFEQFQFAPGVERIEDLKPGMKLPGIVTNVTAFGAFVDIGVHQDGLVHISQLKEGFVRDPTDVVAVRERVTVKVLDVDLPRRRISLSLK
ncbi:MAG TPA: Tex family protein [Methanothrix sp.]|nr:Tex family protein [Methanothrix sp.]